MNVSARTSFKFPSLMRECTKARQPKETTQSLGSESISVLAAKMISTMTAENGPVITASLRGVIKAALREMSLPGNVQVMGCVNTSFNCDVFEEHRIQA